MEEPQPIYPTQVASPLSKTPAWLHSDPEQSKGKELVARAHTASRPVPKNSGRPRKPTRASSLSSQTGGSASPTSPRPGPSLSPFQYLDESPEYPRDDITISGTTVVGDASSSKNALSERFGTVEPQHTTRRHRNNVKRSKPVIHGMKHSALEGPTDYHVAMPANLKADGVWTTGQSKDVTIHLEFDTQDDIEDVLEAFSHWHQIGSFKNARLYFTEELKEHTSNPYVLVHYMETLLDQGHYLAVKPLCQSIIHFLELSDSSGGQNADNQFLKVYVELVAAFAASHGPCQIENLADTLESAVMNLDLITWGRNYQGGSTEIRLMSILFRFRGRCRSEVNEAQYSKLLEWAGLSNGLETVLSKLLRDGRVWDMCLFVKALAEANCLRLSPDKIVEWLNELVSAWKPSHDDDVATELALLDLLVFISSDPLCFHYRKMQPGILELAGPLAETISQKHPEYMKSRPYLRWILARVACGARFSEGPPPSLHGHTRPFDGLSYDWDTDMPIYIPAGNENPGWKQTSATPDMLEMARLALNSAIETEDFKTEAIALQTLINLSRSPYEEFEELCYLQKVVQGDIEGYMETLISKYLISRTDQARDQLRKDIWEQISLPTFECSFSGGLTWLSNMLFSTLESDEQQVSAARDRADKCWFKLEPDLRQAIIQRPHLTRHLFTDNAIDTWLETMSQAVHKPPSMDDAKRENIGKELELTTNKNWSDTMQPNTGHLDDPTNLLAETQALTNPAGVAQRSTSSFRKTDKPEIQRSVRFQQEGSFDADYFDWKMKREKNEEYTTAATTNNPPYVERTELPADGVTSTQLDSPSTVLSANEDKHPGLLNSIPEDEEKNEDEEKEEVEDNPWSINPSKPKKKGKSMVVNWDDYDDYEDEEEKEEEEKTAEPAPATVEEKKDDDFDLFFKSKKSKKDKKKRKSQAVFSWDEPEEKSEEALEPLVASQDLESTKAVEDDLWGAGWGTTTKKKGEKGVEESDPPVDALPSDEDWSIGVPKKDKKKTKKGTFSWGDEPDEPAPDSVEPLEEDEMPAGEDFWDTFSTKKKDKKGENAVEEKESDLPEAPEPEKTKDDDDWSSWGMKKKKKKKKTTFSWGDESIDSERQPSVIKAEDEDDSENAPPAINQTRRPLQEVESPRPDEETTGPPARRQSL